MAQGEGLSPAWDPPPPDPGLDPWVVLEVDRSARPEVIEAAFGVLREMAARDEQEEADDEPRDQVVKLRELGTVRSVRAMFAKALAIAQNGQDQYDGPKHEHSNQLYECSDLCR